MPDFTAREPALGYLYQARYALALLLSGVEEQELMLESLDDIVLEQSGSPRELLQTKHHVTAEARLTDASPELWKTLRVWSTMIAEGKVHFLAEQFRPDALPIDFLDAAPDSVNASTDDRLFVQQLRAVKVKQIRIEKAILDYYRAFEQRSRWAREELLVGGEVQSYEKRLIDEWERFVAAATEDLPADAKDIALERVGREIFNWMEQKADLRIRPNVTEPYVMRGSYHDLANRPSPTVWWHPQFFERLAAVVAAGEEGA